MKQFAVLILMTVQAVENVEIGKELEAVLEMFPEHRQNLKTAIQQILADDEKDKDKLCEPLNYEDAAIITAILEGIERPESLKWFEQD